MNTKKRSFVISLILSLVFLLTGCSAFSSNKKAEGVALDFLTEFFTFNKDNRSHTFADVAEDIESDQKGYDDYFLPFEDIASQKCIETMYLNREPFKYDTLAFENDLTVSINDIKTELLRENVYAFEITFNSAKANEIFKAPIEGEITLSVFENDILVDSFVINK